MNSTTMVSLKFSARLSIYIIYNFNSHWVNWVHETFCKSRVEICYKTIPGVGKEGQGTGGKFKVEIIQFKHK